jgi:hypothetical protein
VNGVEVSASYSTGDGNAAPIQPTDTSVYIGLGEDGTTAGEQWLGSIGETRIYNRALTASEVSQNFTATRSKYGV